MTQRDHSNQRRLQRVLLLFSSLIFIFFAYAVEQSLGLPALRSTLRTQTVPQQVLDTGPRGRIMRALGMVAVVPNAEPAHTAKDENDRDGDHTPVAKKQSDQKYAYRVTSDWRLPQPTLSLDAFNSTRKAYSRLQEYEGVLPQEWPLVSIILNEEDLTGSDGILSKPTLRGRKYERRARVCYYEKNKLLFATDAGVRVHGGWWRGKHRQQAFRIYFRRLYGASEFPAYLFHGETEAIPIRTVVARHSFVGYNTPHPFVFPLSFDITRRMGGIVPNYRPILFSINGSSPLVYTLTEHLGRRQWDSHFSHDNYLFYIYKNEDNDELSADMHDKLLLRIRDPQIAMTMDEVGKYVDLDNFSRHLFSIIFCATTDWRQGVAVRDMSDDNGKWFWINWDMDQSFLDHSFIEASEHKAGRRRDVWDQRGITLITAGRQWWWKQGPKMNERDVRSILFVRLCQESPSFRSYFVRLGMDIMNHLVDSSYLKSRIAHYARLQQTLPQGHHEELDVIASFLNQRAKTVRRQLKDHFDLPDAYSCSLQAVDGVDYNIEIDGFPSKVSYTGWYFRGQPISIKISGPGRARFMYWMVNGQLVSTQQLVHRIEKQTIIKPVFSRVEEK